MPDKPPRPNASVWDYWSWKPTYIMGLTLVVGVCINVSIMVVDENYRPDTHVRIVWGAGFWLGYFLMWAGLRDKRNEESLSDEELLEYKEVQEEINNKHKMSKVTMALLIIVGVLSLCYLLWNAFEKYFV